MQLYEIESVEEEKSFVELFCVQSKYPAQPLKLSVLISSTYST